MGRRLRNGASLALVLALSACGGGDSGGPPPSSGPAPTPTPSPSPSPTPTPSPTPSPTYTPFANLTGDRSLAVGCTAYVGRPPLGVPGVEGFASFGNNGLITFTQATESYRVFTPNNVSSVFGPSALQTQTDPNVIRYTKPSPRTPGATENFFIATPVVGGQGFVYTRGAFINIEGDETTGTQARTQAFCVTGVPTINTDLPPGPTVTFTGFEVRGTVFDARNGTLRIGTINGTEAALVVDLTTGNANFSFAVDTSFGGTPTRIGTYQGSGGLNEATSGLAGNFDTGGGLGSIDGGFFGPQGSEFAYVFNYRLDQNFDGANELFFVGTVAGRR
ncbi:hypothetical protein [Porphyrobacter sp. HT-58-2]|uniref:hypothetical protein n=1 Tax=Porphyrobacter sp. HT-58-2 TaxID=2023229 RepID=UPI0018F8990C|nr:hypothetical protein [Porphyrobacter sp. HT-58-2]